MPPARIVKDLISQSTGDQTHVMLTPVTTAASARYLT